MAACSSLWLAQKHMRRTLARDVLGALVAQSARVDVPQEVLSRTEQDWSDREVQLVDQRRLQVFADSGNAAAKSDVPAPAAAIACSNAA